MNLAAATSNLQRDRVAGRCRLSAYPSYRPSGVAWLPTIPAGWGIKRLRYALTLPTKSETRGLPPGRVVSFVPMEAVGEYGGLSLEQTKVIEDVLNGYTYFRDGDVVVAKITPCFENGKGALAEGLEGGIGFGTTELYVLRAGPELDRRYLFYLTLGEDFRKLGTAEMYGAGGQKRVPESFIRELRHPIPPLDEQRAIAAFLDRETARIDALIAKKHQLIELLQEKRTALISHTVAFGLNPNATMTETNHQCFRRIPAHWTLVRLRHISPHQTVGVVVNPSSYFEDTGVPILLGNNVGEGRFFLDGVRFISEASNRELHKSMLRAGDIVVVRVGEPGIAAVISQELDRCNCASMMLVRQGPRFESDWLCYAFNSRPIRSQVDMVKYGAAQKQFNISHAVNFWFPVPPKHEQAAIVQYLNERVGQFEQLATNVETVIDQLREYRSALISAAVTGKIDVRRCREGEQCQ